MNAFTRHWEAIKASLAEEETRGERATMEEAAFLPAALEIIEQPVSPTARRTAWVLLIGLAFTLLWLTFGKVDIVASAPGKLLPASNVQLVQPSEAGVVRAILVRDGQHVKKGQPLISLDPTVSTAEAIQAEKALETAQLNAARGRAVLSGIDTGRIVFKRPEGMTDDVATTQIALARAQLAQIDAQVGARTADKGMALAALSEAEVNAAKLRETLPLLDQQIEANEAMLAKGYVSKLRVIEMRRQRLGVAKDLEAALETARRQRSQINSASLTRDQARAQARSDVLADLAKAEEEIKLRTEELSKAKLRSNLQVLRSPSDGIVAQLAVHTVGGVVEATKPLMLVVPNGGTLVAEVRVLNRDAGGIRPGQEVAVKLEAYPFTRYGTVDGVMDTISSDAIDDEHMGLVYVSTVRLKVDADDLKSRGITLASGMAVTADIHTGRRSILSYLVSPLDAVRREAARER